MKLQQFMEAKCIDCGIAYSDFGVDLTLPDDQWKLIHPDVAGLLCATCIAKRADRLPGTVVIALRCHLDIANNEDPDTCPSTGRHVDDCGACTGEYCETHYDQPCDCDSAQRHTITRNPIGPQRATPASVAKIQAEVRQRTESILCEDFFRESGEFAPWPVGERVEAMGLKRVKEPVA